MPTAETIRVEVLYAPPRGAAFCVTVMLPADAHVGDALRASGLAQRYPDAPCVEGHVGIHARLVALDTPLADGDRVEVYRPLAQDPREARRQRARR